MERHGTGYRLETPRGTLEADRVVLAVPAFVAGRLLEPLAPDTAEALQGIPYVDTAVVTLAFPRAGVEHPLEGTGFIVPASEGRALTACTWLSSKWPDRSPPEAVLVRAFFGRRGQEEPARLPEEDLKALALEELREVLGLTAPPLGAWVHR
jgi:oxygen-dependent protoporphyrinogen oxidase